MQLKDILKSGCVKVPLEATEKSQAITELIKLLDDQGLLSDCDTVLKAVFDREAIRSTGIGQGFAIPHGKTAAVNELVMAVGKTAAPIDFDSIDGEPVSIIVLLVSPVDKTGPHIQALAQISKIMTDKFSREHIWDSQSAEQMYHYLCEPH